MYPPFLPSVLSPISLDRSSIILAPVERAGRPVACNIRKAEQRRRLMEPVQRRQGDRGTGGEREREETLAGEKRAVFGIERACNRAYTGASAIRSSRSRSKSLSRGRSFSITAECNYKGARNCGPGVLPPRRGNRETSRRSRRCRDGGGAFPRKISSWQMDP